MGQFPMKYQWLLFVMTTVVCMSLSDTITPDGMKSFFILPHLASNLAYTFKLKFSTGEVLLSIKTAIIGSDGVFLNWRQEDSDPCNWKGVTCDSNTKRVTHV